MSLKEAYKKNRRERKRSIEGVLGSLQKQKQARLDADSSQRLLPGFANKTANQVRTGLTKEFEAKKFVINQNYSTKMMTFRKSKRLKAHSHRTDKHQSIQQRERGIDTMIPALDRQYSVNKNYSRKESVFEKRPSLQLPELMSIAPMVCVQINGKDKQLQQLFLRIARISNPNEFLYNVNMPRRFLLDFLAKEYTREFAQYFSWFFDLRPTIDYKYYLDIGEKLLQMNGQLVAHFVYAAFDGLSLDACFGMFRQNFASKDLLFVNNIKEHRQPGSTLIIYQKRTYEYLKNGGKMRRQESSFENSQCGMTMYRSSFLYNDSKLDPQLRTERDLTAKGRPRKQGQISFEEFCAYYSGRTPNLYVDLLFRLYLVEVVEGQLEQLFKQGYLQSICEQPKKSKIETTVTTNPIFAQQKSHSTSKDKPATNGTFEQIRVDKVGNLKLYAQI